MADYNKIITTVNSISPEHQYTPNPNNNIVIDTSENRIGINTIRPETSIHVSGGTIKTQNLIVLGDLSTNIVASELLPKNDLSYNLGSIDHSWKDIYVGPGTIYMDNTPIIYMGDYTRQGQNDISALIIDNSGRPLDISNVSHVNMNSDVSINMSLDISVGLIVLGDISMIGNFDSSYATASHNNVDISGDLTVLNDVSFMDKLVVNNDTSFNKGVDISGVLNITELINSNGAATTGTKMYTKHQPNSQGNMTTRFIIDPSGDSLSNNGEVVIMGNLDIKGTAAYINFINVDISDNIIRMNANHSSVTDGGITVTNSSGNDKLFSYNNPNNYWTTNNTNINLGPDGGIVTSGYMNVDNINIDGNTIDVDAGDLVLKSDTGQVQFTALQDINITSSQQTIFQSLSAEVVVENVTFNSNTISTTTGIDLNLTAAGGDIFTQNSNLDLGSGVLTVDNVVRAHMPTGGITLWYGISGNVPIGWAICDGSNGTPNLSGRFVVCSGNNTETNYTEDLSGGTDNYTLNTTQLPSHNHDASSQHTDVLHNHAASSQYTDVIHNHDASSQNTDVIHNHDASSQNTDVSHNHGASSQNTDVIHTHTASLLFSQDSTVNHSHQGGINPGGTVHTHNGNNQVDLGSWTGHTEETHGHVATLDQDAHNHTTDLSGIGDDHQHSISDSQAPHGHGLEFHYAYSDSGGGTGTQSLLLDDQVQGTLQATQLGGGFVGGVQTDNAPHDHTTESVQPTHPFHGQTEHLHTLSPTSHDHTAVMQNSTDTSHTHTTQVTPGGSPHNHTITTQQTSIDHNHQLTPTMQTSINHNHVIQTDQTSIDHNHVIQTEQTSIDHNHVIQTTPTSIDHNHVIQTTPTGINHNHVIQTETTGGGSAFDNRPKWYGLWYIMKL
jgi:hypothetical protein